MVRKIEQLLRVAGDLHRFAEGNCVSSSHASDELSEDDLDLIAAAAYEPVSQDPSLHKNPDNIR